MDKPLVVLGARWLAEEMSDLISEIPGCEITAFIENVEPERCGKDIDGLPVLWVDRLPEFVESHYAICALGTTHRNRLIERAAGLGMRFVTLVHPTARVSARAELGEGCFVSAQAVVSTKSKIGNHVFLNRGVLIGHHVTIGDYVSVQCGANVGGLATIGEGTYVAMGAVVLDRVNVGRGCVVGAGAVVTDDVPDNTMVLGVPARIVKTDIDGK